MNPQIIDCPEDTWTLIGEVVTSGIITEKITSPQYYYTLRDPGDSAPTDLSDAIPMDEVTHLPNTNGIDVYVYAQSRDGQVIFYRYSNVLNVNKQDQRSRAVDLLFSRDLAETSLTVAPNILDNSITVADASAAVAETTYVELWDVLMVGPNKIPFFMQAQVRAVDGNDIEMYMPVGFPYNPITTVVRIVECNMAIPTGATFESPLIYSIDPPKILGTTQFVDFDQTRFFLSMLHASAGDDSKYGDIAGGLTNGIYYRSRSTIDEETVYVNGFNTKNNGDWRERSLDVIYSDRAGGNNLYSTTIRKSYNGDDKSGLVIPIRAELNESSEAVLRDDISTLTRHHIVSNGHVVIP